jgi:predicted dienelactone hydrolase
MANMKRTLLLIALLAYGAIATAAGYDDKKGNFRDKARDRDIPYKAYYPKPLEGKYPVIIVSHGLGGTRDGNAQLGRRLAANGFIAIHIEHPGSDDSAYKGARSREEARAALRRSLTIDNALARYEDVPFVVSQLATLDESDKALKGHLNVAALGMAGHSYGAISTLVAAGERLTPRYMSFKVPTLRAGLLLSPSPPGERLDAVKAYQDVSIPLFHMTGTNDNSELQLRNVTAKDRLTPYRTLKAPKQYLLVLDAADHMTFSGREEGRRDKQHLEAVLTGAVAFFQAYLYGEPEKEAWLRTEYKNTLDAKDVFEFK